jgi:hypothetical protein
MTTKKFVFVLGVAFLCLVGNGFGMEVTVDASAFSMNELWEGLVLAQFRPSKRLKPRGSLSTNGYVEQQEKYYITNDEKDALIDVFEQTKREARNSPVVFAPISSRPIIDYLKKIHNGIHVSSITTKNYERQSFWHLCIRYLDAHNIQQLLTYFDIDPTSLTVRNAFGQTPYQLAQELLFTEQQNEKRKSELQETVDLLRPKEESDSEDEFSFDTPKSTADKDDWE